MLAEILIASAIAWVAFGFFGHLIMQAAISKSITIQLDPAKALSSLIIAVAGGMISFIVAILIYKIGADKVYWS